MAAIDVAKSGSTHSRRDVLRKVGLAAVGAGVLLVAEEALFAEPAAAAQSGWRFCVNCKGLYYPNGGGWCPYYGGRQAHTYTPGGVVSSFNYVLWNDASISGFQTGWRWCGRCQGLFYAFNGGSACPKGGAHNSSGSLAYMVQVVPNGTPASDGSQSGWAWCRKCQGLFYRPLWEESSCPIWGAGVQGNHQGDNSLVYALAYTA